MAYRKFKLSDLETKFGVQSHFGQWLDASIIQPIEPSSLLKSTIERARLAPLSTEKAVSERIISPIMTEILASNIQKIQLFSGENINADESQGLIGEIDFLFNHRPHSLTPEMPIFSITESKIGLLHKAWGQAAAQIIGVSLLNQKQNHTLHTIFGSVTDGNSWQFLRYTNQIISIDSRSYSLVELPLILGIFQYFIDFEY